LEPNILFFLILIIAAVLAFLYIPAFFMRRAITKVRGIFHQHGAIGIENAKTIDELGLSPANLFQRLTKPRDYKPHALRYLKQAGIVSTTEEGKLYMAEETRNEKEIKGR
jgi:hypothetical protein